MNAPDPQQKEPVEINARRGDKLVGLVIGAALYAFGSWFLNATAPNEHSLLALGAGAIFLGIVTAGATLIQKDA